jgi:hypothetical protein
MLHFAAILLSDVTQQDNANAQAVPILHLFCLTITGQFSNKATVNRFLVHSR